MNFITEPGLFSWKLALEKNRGNRVIIYAICSISLLAMIGTKSSTSTIATIVAIVAAWYRFGLIDVPDEVKEKMGRPKARTIGDGENGLGECTVWL